jgi:hypothetical protein
MALLNTADKICLGDNVASNVYLGSTRVWPKFRPTDLAGCCIWLDASSLNYADGAAVSLWPNLGAGPAPALLGSPAPTLRANALNTKPVVRLTQGQGCYRFTGHSADRDYTLVYVGRRWQLSAGRVIAAQDTAANMLIGYHGNEMDMCYIEEWLTSSTSPTSTTEWKLYSADSMSTAVARFFVNGALYASGTVTSASKGWGGTLCINGYTNDADIALSQQTDCEMAELALYDRKLSDTERVQIESYMRTKYAM